MSKKIIIVGGVAGGATCAARLRRLNENDEIIIFEKGEYISFANCGLPYFIGGVIKNREELILQTPKRFKARFNVDVRTRSEVIKINRDKKTVTIKDLAAGKEYTESYDVLVLSPGASPIKPPMPGVEDQRVFTLRTVPDADKIKKFIEEKKPREAVVVGGGFIGLEMAENLNELGIHVTVVEKLNQVMPNLDADMANAITQHMKNKKVSFILGAGIEGFESGKKLKAKLENGDTLECDMALLSIGVKPDTKFVKEANLEVAKNGAILVDSKFRTNDENIFSVGDAVIVKNPVCDTSWGVALAGPANRQARIVADVISGKGEDYHGTIGTSIVKIFDIAVGSTGCSEKYLQSVNKPYLKSYTHTANHVGYYPGATPVTVKLMFDPKNGKVLGSQMVGISGVDKRIDVVASVIRNGGTVNNLQSLELAYAPPFGAAKDPVNIAGYVAENIISNNMKVCHWHDIELYKKEGDKYYLLDVRTEDEFSLGSIDGAVNIPVDKLREKITEIPKDKTIIVFCQVGLRGYIAYRILEQKGYNALNLSGGYKTYLQATLKDSKFLLPFDEFIGSDDMILSSTPTVESQEIVLDTCGMACPGPIKKTYEKMQKLKVGDVLKIKASDSGFAHDIEAWCKTTGNELVSLDLEAGIYSAVVRKTEGKEKEAGRKVTGNEKTIVVFSGDLDKVLAAFIIATGAASMGQKVNMFFTFWGLNALRKESGPSLKKDTLSKMFGMMMPKGADKLKLSKMNMGGVGTKMMKHVMKNKNVDSLSKMMQEAQRLGVKLVACQMSMDVMGISKDELIDDVETGGVAAFLADSDRSNATIFV